ncbi:MAG: GNAT family N-acetyltransferase, partial [Anaerolineaceae bacterium]
VGIDTTDAYRRMYAALAGEWVRCGFFCHAINVPAGNAQVQEAWVSLGFGRKTTAAVRSTAPVETSSTGLVDVHRASAEDIDVVVALERTLARHHAGPPIFWPDLRETDDSSRHHQLELIADPASAYFVAYEGGRATGMQTFVRPGYTPRIVDPDSTVYLYEGVVEPDARGSGLGTGMLSHSMAWAREQGYANCCLHFASDNPSGAPFWLGQGFVPVEHTMVRRVDERIAWAGVP